jgi:hypothetical protein
MIKSGVVTEVVILYKDKGFRYIVCKPEFFETCEKYIEKLKLRGIDFTKINTETEKEWYRKILVECENADKIVYS